MLERALDRSSVRALLKGIGARLHDAIARSTVLRIPRGDAGVSKSVTAAVGNSRFTLWLASVSTIRTRIRWVLANSWFRRIGERGRLWTRSSTIRQWVVRDPAPQAVVVDVRETRTVGPLIRLLGRVAGELVSNAPTSTVGRVSADVIALGRERPVATAGTAVLPATVVSGSLVALSASGSSATLIAHAIVAVLAVIGLHDGRSFEEILASRSVRSVTSAFEPPEQPATIDGDSPQSGTE